MATINRDCDAELQGLEDHEDYNVNSRPIFLQRLFRLKDHEGNNVSSRLILFRRPFVLRYPILTSIGSRALCRILAMPKCRG